MQHYSNIEYIVQDGASTDGTLGIFEEYREAFSGRMHVVSERDTCGGDGMWRGIARSRGEIVCVSMADEELLPESLPFVMKEFSRHPEIDVVHGDIYNTDLEGKVHCRNMSTDFDLVLFLACRLPMHFAASFFRRSAFEKAGLLPLPSRHRFTFDDYFIWTHLALQCRMRYYPAVFAKYAIHAEAMSTRPDGQRALVEGRAAFLDEFFSRSDLPEAISSQRKACLTSFYSWGIHTLMQCNLQSAAENLLAALDKLNQEPENLPESGKRSKVLLISLPGIFTGDEPLFPLGIGYLLASLRKDREAEALHYQKAEHARIQLSEALQQYAPDIVGLTCTSFNRGLVREVCNWLRANHPGVRILLGGVHVSFMYEQALKDYGADCVVIGEGETTIREVCDAWDRNLPLHDIKGIAFLEAGEVVLTQARLPIQDMDELPMPDYSFAGDLMRQHGIGFLISSRGCPVRCSFCSTGSYWGQKVRSNSPTRVVDEMEALVAQYGVRKIFFHDDTFNLGTARVLEICREIKARGLKVEFGVSCRVHPVSQEMIDAMVDAGCRHICWGIESGSEEMLKRIDKKITKEQIKNAFALCRKHLGTISVGAFTMVGNPGENEATINESVQFIDTLELTDNPSTAVLYILPGTTLYKELAAKHPDLERYWVECDDIPNYTIENSAGQLLKWASRISQSGKLVYMDRSRHFWDKLLFGEVPVPQPPRFPWNGSTKAEVATAEKLRILLVYSLHPVNPKVTIPEWIKESFRLHFANRFEVFACGPNNEIDIQDSLDFYDKVAQVVEQLQIDILWDIEGGALSTDFMFKRFPTKIKIPRVFWAIDTHQFLNMQVEKARYFDLVFSAQKNAVPHLGPNSAWLPLGASLHEIDHHLERTIDVGFVGNIVPGLHERRRQVVERLKREIPGFNHYCNVFFEDKARLSSSMKIIVNISLRNDLNLRVFETMACGAMLITDRLYDNGLEDLFEDGKHLVTFETEDELVAKIRYYLSHEAERTAIARTGQERVLANFTHTHIIKHALHFMTRLCQSSRKASRTALDRTRCWCGGRLTPSVHPLYGECAACGTQVLKEMLSEEQLKSFYTMGGYWHEYQNVLANFPTIEERSVNDFKDRIPVWHQFLARYNPAPERLLEIGCAHGGFLSYCRDRGARNVVGVEVDEKTCAFARARFNLPHVVSGLFPEVQLPFEKFDMITGFDVIEHFRDPVAGIRAVAEHLAEDGMFLFQTPCYRGESSTWQQFKAEEHLFLYNEQSVRDLFARCGLTVTETLPGYFRDDMFVVGKKSSKVGKILYLRPDSIGDNVLAAGMLPRLKQRYPQAEIVAFCQQHISELYEACPAVDAVIAFDRAKAYQSEEYRNLVLKRLQGVGADLALNSLYSREPLYDLFAIGCGAPERVAFRGDCCNIPADMRDENSRLYTRIIGADPVLKPELERHREFLEAQGCDASQLTPTIWTTEEDERVAEEFFRDRGLDPQRTVALFACGQWGEKIYPHYGEALREICSKERLTLLALGSLRDAEVNRAILEEIGAPGVNLAGGTTIRQGAALVRRCRLGIGADTGTAHIACAVGTPNVVMLGGGHFGRFHPYSPLSSIVALPLACYQCNWNCRYSQAHCIRSIDPEVVAVAFREALARGSSKPRVYLQGETAWCPLPGEPQWGECGQYLDAEQVEIRVVEKSPDNGARMTRCSHAAVPGGNMEAAAS